MIEIYIKLSSIAIFLLIVLLLAAIIPFIKLQNEKRKYISELSKTTHDFSQNLKATYKKMIVHMIPNQIIPVYLRY